MRRMYYRAVNVVAHANPAWLLVASSVALLAAAALVIAAGVR